ncbi:YgeY family selenium metabolism-linked hydrolase [Oceanidesulfovibrio indonesiensis]|uniref:YgeY family selenium metabolism-linked hydrolase n=1 Tax=Oceanidesulfovibrio indonesiensis TaxID=54767 RepID=A0A7M3MBX4_9BACT|nr:YgeY family selenium metabolism-linked hydrolase [Oceanidesulfovibrio indonesiensis]TVM15808.1 YgeY family selenium metabolism-linked hydrolase [Oceanidesulfovibrio indonesiensis]
MYEKLNQMAEDIRDDVIGFAQKLVQTPSISGAEEELAQLTVKKMEELGYDEIFVDDMGNVVGIVKGEGSGPNVMYNSHMDHVAPGEEANWEFPPYGGVIADGYLHGRAASDVKSGMASQIFAGHLIKKSGVKLKGDFIYTGVVQEEPAEMFGMRWLMDKTFKERGITFDVMISSEATSMNLYLGHRGRAELEVTTFGRTSHGSAPWLGVNAVYKMMPVIEEVRKIYETLPEDDFLGRATIALTIINCSPGALSIIPDKCTVSLDRRLVRGEKREDFVGQIQKILDDLAAKDEEFKGEVKIRTVKETSYKGISEDCEKYMHSWAIEKDDPMVVKCVEALNALGQNPGFGRWDFGTDASYVTGVMGIPSIGYSPMEEHYAHTPKDRCSIENIVKATAGNAAIAYAVAGQGSRDE